MSYLLGPRLHFAGRFKADVSTVNNDVDNFHTNTPDGSWNPGGSGRWTLSGCKVTGAVLSDGKALFTTADDSIIDASIGEMGTRAAKIVDLDPQQQVVSQLWGLQLQCAATGGAAIFSGKFEAAAFSDLWNRVSHDTGGDFTLAAYWQSLLTDIVWGNLGGSTVLEQIKQASLASTLSIKFNLDGFDMNPNSPTFTTGRIVGAIGAASADEPHHFTIGRQCMPKGTTVSFFPAVVDAKRGKLIADLGNALPTPSFGGPVDSSLGLELGLLPTGSTFKSLGKVTVGKDQWYEQTAGIVEVPPDRPLSADEMTSLRNTPIALAGQSPTGKLMMLAQEGIDGFHVRPDQLFARISPEGTANIQIYASKFGERLANEQVAVSYDASGLRPGSTPATPVGTPTQALTFPGTFKTDSNGAATLTLTAHDPGNRRRFIDGQIYGVRCALQQAAHGSGAYRNRLDFVSVLVWNSFTPSSGLTWWDDIQPILHQYANLYPFMKNFLDLGDYDSVVDNIANLQQVFSLPETNPHYMPVTRDLSPAKRQAILNWLGTTGNAGKPNLGTPPQQPMAAVVAHVVAGPGDGGGKTAAMAAYAAQDSVILTRV